MTTPGRYLGAGPQQVHPLTPVLKAWKALVVAVVVLAVNAGAGMAAGFSALFDLTERAPLLGILLVIGALVGVGAVAAAITIWSWQVRYFELDAQEIRLGHGILFRQRRSARYDRVQSVDIRQPLLPRLFGLGEVTVETAGGSDSGLAIGYLRLPELEKLRAEILAAARGETTPLTASSTQTVAPPAPADGGGEVLNGPVPPGRLIGMVLLTGGLVAVFPIAGAVIAGLFGAGFFSILIAAGGALAVFWAPLDKFWHQKLTLNRENRRLQVAAGLASTRRQTIPLHRVHALQIRRPLAWRMVGWSRLESSIAGYSAEDDESAETTLVAVDADARVADTMDTVLTSITTDDRTPTRTWSSPARAKWVSPLDWERQSVALSPAGISATWGLLSERASTVPWRHVQGAALTQGPLQRLAGVADVRAAVVSGPAQVVARDLAVDDAQLLLAEVLAERREAV